jgi:hypothetical protein
VRYWVRRMVREARAGRMDGVFADSLSVPHYLGAESFDPPLTYFEGEAAWTRRVNSFMRYAKRRLRGRLRFVPNAGSMITTRDRTDYAIPDGVMVEGCAQAGPDAGYAPVDWALQQNRILRIVRRGRIVICQSYLGPEHLDARGFVLASATWCDPWAGARCRRMPRRPAGAWSTSPSAARSHCPRGAARCCSSAGPEQPEQPQSNAVGILLDVPISAGRERPRTAHA